jgi:predicted outer membrane lipoprotein
MKKGSPPGNLNKHDFKKILLGSLVAFGGALLLYLSIALGATDFGVWNPLATAFCGVIVNAVRLYVMDTRAKDVTK